MREMVANRMSEGDSILSMKSGVLIATLVAANMVISIVLVCRERVKERERKKKK